MVTQDNIVAQFLESAGCHLPHCSKNHSDAASALRFAILAVFLPVVQHVLFP